MDGAEVGNQIFLFEVREMEMCANCIHIGVCKFIEAAADTELKIKEVNETPMPIRARLECEMFKERATAVKGEGVTRW